MILRRRTKLKQSKHRRFILGLLVVSVATSLLNVGQVNAAEKSNIRLVAVGDSLTEGIGDTTKQQGYTKRTAKLLTKAYGVRVQTANYGKAGDRSDQILRRVKADKKAVRDIKKADVIVMTVGGNDLQQTLFKAIFAKSDTAVTKEVVKSMPTYTEKLMKLMKFIKQKNPDAPIFLFGNYNPLYVYLANRQDLNADVKIYNGINANIAAADSQVYYVSTFKTLTYGQYQTRAARQQLVKESEQANQGSLNNKMVQDTLNGKSDKELNAYITTLDHYHPNNKGYDKMSKLLVKRMAEKESEWLVK